MLYDAFEAAVAARDGDALRATLAEDVRFFSPVVFRPYEGREVVGTILVEGVMKVFEDDFTYRHRFEDPAERTAALIFSVSAAGRSVDGLDLLSFDSEGLVRELKVMLRPRSGLEAVAAAMAERFAELGLAAPS